MEYNTINLKEFTHDYTTRTIANYNTIYQAYISGDGSCAENQEQSAFEVTQLINSLFGVLIMPFESTKALINNQMNANEMRKINQGMKEADVVAFNDLSSVIQELKEAKCFYDSYTNDYEKGIAEISFVHRLRNSLAHSGNRGLRFYPIGERDQDVGQIKSIIFCDEEKNGNGNCFIAELSVDQVKRIVNDLASIFGNFTEFEDYRDLREYQKTIRTMRKKMKGVYEGIFEFDKRDLREMEKKFKGNFRSEKIDDNKRRGYTLVFDELEFFTWIFRSKGRYKLIGPEEVCLRMNQMAQTIITG